MNVKERKDVHCLASWTILAAVFSASRRVWMPCDDFSEVSGGQDG
jgi:hypothetical protein